MFKNYIKIALRNLWRNKIFSIINILGLAIGLAGSFFLLLYILNETGYNKCHEKRHHIYRVLEHLVDYEMLQPKSPYYMSESLLADFPEIKASTRVGYIYRVMFKKDENFILERNVYASDPSIFDIFTLPVVSGNKNHFLTDPSSIVISRKIAEKYFPDQDAIGKEMQMKMGEESYTFRVDGVMENIPLKSTLRADILCHVDMMWERSKAYFPDKSPFVDWSFSPCETYLLLPENYKPAQLEDKFPLFVKNYLDEERNVEYNLQALTDIYFHSRHLNNSRSWGNLQRIYTFSLVALLILIIACTNYIILSTAQSMTRYKEIGLRKVVGANRRTLVQQILTEGILVSLFALPVSLVLMEISLSFMNDLLGADLEIYYLGNWKFLLGLLGITILVGILSGSYLAFYLSRLNPVSILNNIAGAGSSKSYVRSALIVLQLVVFSVLIIVSQTISSQINFAKNTDLGYDKENLVKIFIEKGFKRHITNFNNEIKSNPNIINASAASYTPPEMGWQKIKYQHATDPNKNVVIEQLDVDYDFVETLGLKLLQGRNFSRDFAMDSVNAIIISESAVSQFGFTNPVGSTIAVSETEKFHVIGVFNDIHMRSLKEKVMPMVIKFTSDNLHEIIVRHAPGTYDETIAFLEAKMEEFNTGSPMEYISVKENINYLYYQETRLKKTLNTFTFLAIFISILGLFALSLFMVRRKTKTIGIRKVYGASTKDILRLIASEFIALLIIANVIAWPVAWYFANRWLQEYAYRISFQVLPYLIALLASVLLVLTTVTINAARAARANPVDSLKYE